MDIERPSSSPPSRYSIDADTTSIGRYDSVKTTASVDDTTDPTLWPASLSLRSSQQADNNTTLRPISERPMSEQSTTATICHPTPLMIPKPPQQARRKSAEAPQLVTDLQSYSPYTPTAAGLGFMRKEGVDTPVGQQSFASSYNCFARVSHSSNNDDHGDDKYEDESPSAKDIPFPSKKVPKERDRGRLFGVVFVLLVALVSFLTGGATGGGIAAAIQGRPQAPVIKEISPNSTTSNTCTTSSQTPSNLTTSTTCLCCSTTLSHSSISTSTYISSLSPTSLFNLNCSSNLAQPSGTSSLDLTAGAVTTSLSLCIDLCAAWNEDAGKVKDSGQCVGVSWLVQTEKTTGGNLLCVLKKKGVDWTGWTGGARGVSAMLD